MQPGDRYGLGPIGAPKAEVIAAVTIENPLQIALRDWQLHFDDVELCNPSQGPVGRLGDPVSIGRKKPFREQLPVADKVLIELPENGAVRSVALTVGEIPYRVLRDITLERYLIQSKPTVLAEPIDRFT
jgi:hypothetical protein